MNKMTIGSAILGALLLGCSNGADRETCGLVRGGGYETGAAWVHRKIGGRAFLPFDGGTFPRWGTRGFEKSERLRNMPVFRDMAYLASGGVSGKNINDIGVPRVYSRDWQLLPADKVRTEPYAPEDMIAEKDVPAAPFILELWHSRPTYFLHDGYKADRAAYAEWRARHPNFLGFKILAEYDNDINFYNKFVPTLTNAVVRDLMMKRLPVAKTEREWIEQMKTVIRREQDMCFGEKELTWGLNGVSCTLAHRYAALGIRGLIYEAAMNATSGPWVFNGAFTRGAARQFGLPYVWYCAHYVGKGYTRDGKPGSGEMEWPGSWLGYSRPRDKAVQWKGAGRSLLRREMAYGAFIGASGLFPENGHFFLYADGPDGKKDPSPIAEDFNEVYEMAKDGRCGVPYTPVAILSSLYVNCSRHGYTDAKAANLPQMAFMYTLVPACVNKTAERAAYHHSDRKAGDLGCLYNSPFGEIWDVLAPDAGQPTAELERALSAYKCAFLVGQYDKATLDAAALMGYVRNGGTLFVSSDQLDLLPTFAKTPAKALAVPEEGLTAHDVGKGRIVVADAFRMIGKDHPVWTSKDAWTGLVSGEIDFPALKRLLLRVQDETMPCRVTGDCQWGVNRTAFGWFFWAFNNKGVKKFVYEPEDLDPKATSHVAVAFKESAGGARFEFDIPAGGVFYRDIPVK